MGGKPIISTKDSRPRFPILWERVAVLAIAGSCNVTTVAKSQQKGEKHMVCAKVNQMIAAMTASCLSPRELADKAGVGVNTVYRMRRGYLVKMDLFGKVCRALEIEPGDYIDYECLERYQKEACNAKP